MIPAERAHLHIAALTHPGMSGKNNEDRYAVSAFRLEDEQSTPVVFAIISDGIGGHRAGEVAAEMVVETVSQAVAKSNAQYPIQTLRESIMRSSQEISVDAESDPEKKGMGATCASALIVGERLYIAYVGDSRIYLLRSGAVRQISIDHTWVQEAVDAKIIEPEEAKVHPNAHVIRRYLGSKQPVEPDTRLRLAASESADQSEANQGLQLLPGDQIILCSDGLTDLVSDAEILSAVQDKDQEAALRELVGLANQRGGHDNITVIALRLPLPLTNTVILTPQAPGLTPPTPPASQAPLAPPVPQSARKQRQPRKTAVWLLPVIGLLLLVLIALVMGGLYWLYIGSVSTPGTNTAQPVTLPVQVSVTPGSTIAAPSQPASPSPSEPATTPSFPTPVITLTPWPTNTLSP